MILHCIFSWKKDPNVTTNLDQLTTASERGRLMETDTFKQYYSKSTHSLQPHNYTKIWTNNKINKDIGKQRY